MIRKFLSGAILVGVLAVAHPAPSYAGFFGVGISVGFAPPPLPVYVQPPCPGVGYLWTPGYWAYSDDDEDYYWVPGTWVMPPEIGLLWTPGYWGFVGGDYVWHDGYWGPHVGFYGGIDYGFGYFGSGFAGGYWRGGDFFYNRAVTNVTNVNVTNVYERNVYQGAIDGARPSFNGPNGVRAEPRGGDWTAAREPHYGLTQAQRSQASLARSVPAALASQNHGHPAVAATPRPGEFRGAGVTASRHGATATATGAHGLYDGRAAPVASPMRGENEARPANAFNGAPSHAQAHGPSRADGYAPPRAQTYVPPHAQAHAPPHTQAYAPPRTPAYAPPHGEAHAPPYAQAYAPPRTQAYAPPRPAFDGPHAGNYAQPHMGNYAPPPRMGNVAQPHEAPYAQPAPGNGAPPRGGPEHRRW